MIGGGDVSPFAGIFSILTIFMVAAAVGLIAGVVIMIVLAVKNRASQNNMIQTMPMKRYCIKCGARIEEGAAFCVQCGTPVQIQAQPAQGQPLQAQGQPQPMGQPAQGQSAALKVAIRILICLVAGSVSSFLVSGCLSMLPAAMSSVVGVIIFFLVIAAYSALLFFLIYKPLEAKVGKSYALVGGIAFSVVIAIVLATMGVNAITSLPLCIILAAAYTAIIYAYAAKFEKKKNRF